MNWGGSSKAETVWVPKLLAFHVAYGKFPV
jgi:hypothetical protein